MGKSLEIMIIDEFYLNNVMILEKLPKKLKKFSFLYTQPHETDNFHWSSCRKGQNNSKTHWKTKRFFGPNY